VALALALASRDLQAALVRQVAAVSVGIMDRPDLPDLRQGLVLDLEYQEDHQAAVDSNLVAARPEGGDGMEIVEFQSTGEGRSFSRSEALALIDLGLEGCGALMAAQRTALGA